jgi:peptidoglycan/LPS O-acetylase OafA/YrhL
LALLRTVISSSPISRELMETGQPKARRTYYPQLDSLRFFAFLLIFIHHSDLPASLLKDVGWIGVDIFFCLSACLLTKLLTLELEATGRLNVLYYFIRRSLRIWPLYFSYIGLCVILALFFHDDIPLRRVAGLITFTDNFFAAIDGYNPLTFSVHLWTLSYEEQFYLILPFAVMVLHRLPARKRNTILLVMWVAGSFLRLMFISHSVLHPAIYVLPFTHFDSILIGLFVGFTTYRLGAGGCLLGCLLTAAVVMVLPEASVTGYHLAILYPCVGIFAGCVVTGVLSGHSLKKLMESKLLVYFGKISFGLYIFHIFSLNIAAGLMQYRSGFLQTVLGFGMTVILASASYQLMEKPLLRWKERYSSLR